MTAESSQSAAVVNPGLDDEAKILVKQLGALYHACLDVQAQGLREWNRLSPEIRKAVTEIWLNVGDTRKK